MPKTAITPAGRIEPRILLIRGYRVILDSGLAELYGVTTKRLNEQVKRNKERFPADFMFQLSADEANSLRSQFATSNRGGRRYRPYAFTEHGAIMAAGVLNSGRAIEVSIYVVRAFVKLRELLRTHKQLAHKLDQLEKRIEAHDEEIANLFEAIRLLMEPPGKPGKSIGFLVQPALPEPEE
ncbi:MAG TPA: ORF6N domain-containing protein [Candidatus Acidoferrales bacterium]|nr:ORF6N domain-containing protein [Candidatus Acidoferrales bacterium]